MLQWKDSPEAGVFSRDKASTHCHYGQKTDLPKISAFAYKRHSLEPDPSKRHYKPDMLDKK